MSEQARLHAMNAEYESAKKISDRCLGVDLHRRNRRTPLLLGQPSGYAIAMTCWVLTFGIWWLIEAFFINRRIREKNRELYAPDRLPLRRQYQRAHPYSY